MPVPPFAYILLKLAARCNIQCTYCYWFRDDDVYTKPALLPERIEALFLARLEEHLRTYPVEEFVVLFHGGEPMLFGKQRFARLCGSLRELENRVPTRLRLAITTNGTLIDPEWAAHFKNYNVAVTVSIDGPKEVHDRFRIDLMGRGTYERTVACLQTLRAAGVEPGVLAVCDPESDPTRVCDFFVRELGLTGFDILVPDATHEDRPKSISRFYKALFDLWYDRYSAQGVRIRYAEHLAKGALGLPTHAESIGYGPIGTITLLTDGSIEPLDVLRIAGTGFTKTNLNIETHRLQDAADEPLWQAVRRASLQLAPECENCRHKIACGGGGLPSRWSKEKGFDNPSAYCSDLQSIFDHVKEKVWRDLRVELPVDDGCAAPFRDHVNPS
jgi:uncharacterized protein